MRFCDCALPDGSCAGEAALGGRGVVHFFEKAGELGEAGGNREVLFAVDSAVDLEGALEALMGGFKEAELLKRRAQVCGVAGDRRMVFAVSGFVYLQCALKVSL